MFCSICREWYEDEGVTFFNDCGHTVCDTCQVNLYADCRRCEWLDDEWSDEWDEGNGG